MAVNRGKQFEERIKLAFEKIPNISIDRLLDPMAGYSGVRNICDFIVYKYPTQYYIECKSCHQRTFAFSNISMNQWKGLLEKSKIPGVVSGYFIWFVPADLTIFITAKGAEQICKLRSKQSIHCEKDIDLIKKYGVIIPGTKKRILFDYDITSFLENSWN